MKIPKVLTPRSRRRSGAAVVVSASAPPQTKAGAAHATANASATRTGTTTSDQQQQEEFNYFATSPFDLDDEDPLRFSSLIGSDSAWRLEEWANDDDQPNGGGGTGTGAFAWEASDWPVDFGTSMRFWKETEATTIASSGSSGSSGTASRQQQQAAATDAAADAADQSTVLSVESKLSLLSLQHKWTSRVGGQTTTSSDVRSDAETFGRVAEEGEEKETREETAGDDGAQEEEDEDEDDDDELFSGLLEGEMALVLQSRSGDNATTAAAPAPSVESGSAEKSMAPNDEEGSSAPATDDISPAEATPATATDRREALQPTGGGRRADSISTRFQWRGSQPAPTLSDADAGREIAEIAHVLRASLTLQTLVTSGSNAQDGANEPSLKDQVLQGALSDELAESAGKAADQQELLQKQQYLQGLHEFQGREARDALMTLNDASAEEEAVAQLNLLLFGGYLISSTPLGRRSYNEGGTYRFASRKEMEATLLLLQREDASSILGSKEKILCAAIEATLAMPEAAAGSLSDSIVYTAMVTSHQSGPKGKRSIVRRVRHILTYIVGADQLTIRDILRLMAWCRDYRSEDYKQHYERNLSREESDHEQEDKLSALLFGEYRKRIGRQVRKWLDKLSWQRDDIKLYTNPDGLIVSHHPEDIMFMVQVEMNIVREFLPNSNVMAVMADILLEFSLSQIGMKHALKADWANMDVEWMCAVINDGARLLDYIDDFSIFGDTKKHPVLPTFELRKARDSVIDGYQEVSWEVCDLLAHSLMRDLEAPVMDHIFTDRWERDGQLMNCVGATLKDYFDDLSVSGWIPQYEFCRVVKQCISLVAEQYVAAVFAEKHEGRPFSDAKAIPARLVQDRLILMQFFSHVELEMNGRGAKSHAESCLEVLLLMAAILEADEPDEVEEEINSFYSHVGTKYGRVATMCLVDRKGSSYSQKRHDKWDAAITMITKEDQIQGSRLPNLDLDHLLANNQINPFGLPISPASKRRNSVDDSYDAEDDDDATSYTRTIDSSDSDTTMLTNQKAFFANNSDRFAAKRGRGKKAVDTNEDKLKILADQIVTLSSEAFCWIMDSTLEMCNDLQVMLIKVEEKGCKSYATEVAEDIFTSMSHESFSSFEDEIDYSSKTLRQKKTKSKKKKSIKFWKRSSKKSSA